MLDVFATEYRSSNYQPGLLADKAASTDIVNEEAIAAINIAKTSFIFEENPPVSSKCRVIVS